MKTHSGILLAVVATLATSSIGHGDPIHYYATLSGLNESPPNGSPATGFADVSYDSVTHLLGVSFSFDGLTGPTTAAHIHATTATPLTGTAGVATTVPYFSGFPTGVTSGTYANILDLTLAGSFNPSFVTANGGTVASAEAALAAALAGNQSYLNVHSQTFPGGEIRGFLIVPESSTYLAGALLGAGLVIQLAVGRRLKS